MELHLLPGRTQSGYADFGGMWEKGAVKTPCFSLKTADGAEVPVQSRVTARWPDGSVKWSAHTADSAGMGSSVVLLPIPCGTADNGAAKEKPLYRETAESFLVDTGVLLMKIPKASAGRLALDVTAADGTPQADDICPVLQLERRYQKQAADGAPLACSEVREYRGIITRVALEEAGPLQLVFCFHGKSVAEKDMELPFVIRMYLGRGSGTIRLVHTLLYDGQVDRDYLKGMGIRIHKNLQGKLYDRHIQFGTEGPQFHENAVILASSHPRLSADILRRQQQGARCAYPPDSEVENVAGELPVWQHFSLCQDSAYHYAIRKKTYDDCCALTCREGKRAPGVMAVTDGQSGLLLGKGCCACTAWFYAPETPAFDFRHYEKRGYPHTCYEGFDEVGGQAYGIGVTSECLFSFYQGTAPDQAGLTAFAERVAKPPVYLAAPEYYHKQKAFGYWSLVSRQTETERWLEDQLDKAFTFYKNEVEARDWYGLFNYGDVMHSYDPVRHCWKYDMGGFAWQNTELVPTYWLSLYFLRTGREDVFTLLEAMCRHSSEVDIYHLGPFKGIGSRHNVRHWGCSCKEPRISMAGHHRVVYYLTGDRRLGDIFDEVKDSDHTMANLPHFQVRDADGQMQISTRSGPDWSSFVSNWMTQYERTLDPAYKAKILQGTADIAATPFGLASGPDYFYDMENAKLIYRGELEETPNQHLQICMGGPEIWLETADILGDDTLKDLLADLGEFYFASREEKIRRTGGKITRRAFSWPMFATAVAAYSALRKQDAYLAAKTWAVLLGCLLGDHGTAGYTTTSYAPPQQGKRYEEIPWNSTNFTAQWCLNTMLCLEFIPGYLPGNLADAEELVRTEPIGKI